MSARRGTEGGPGADGVYAVPAGQRWKQAAAAALMQITLLYIGRRLHARRMTATRGHLPGN